MQKTQKTITKQSVLVLLGQIFVAFLILLFFSLYVFALQEHYDTIIKSYAGYKRAFFFTLLILASGIAYDCAKKVLFLKQSSFINFFKHLAESVVAIVIFLILCLLTAYTLDAGYIFAGQLVFIGLMGWELVVISSIAKTIDDATK